MRKYRTAKFREKLEGIDPRSDPKAHFNLVGSITGKKARQPKNQSIKFKGRPRSDHKVIADLFNKQYTTV